MNETALGGTPADAVETPAEVEAKPAPKHQYELPVPDKDTYVPSYGIIVVLADEAEQIQAFTNISALGYKNVRVLTI